ncbi:hypothetical protein [Effusibacillus dendaii]|uniref:Uncharacterized protein n=1 Tax=Effusibacillus dendaii TaxID=2743772 RepID=A0A7I8D7X1_9BACL|nr:hypothetical protein [Effusibacillus dendaii]BCJ85099.1 hypothetical protein skT53_00840 [Effusibacillus dendaii]
MSQFAATVVAPEYSPHLKHKVNFDTFDNLRPGGLVYLGVSGTGSDPVSDQNRPGVTGWRYARDSCH